MQILDFLKYLIPIFIVFTIAVRPVLPLFNYAINYEYIVEKLCENRDRPQLMCNGKCYISKELAKTNREATTQNGQKITIPNIDVFVVTENFKFSFSDINTTHDNSTSTFYTCFYNSILYSKIFHPPLA